MPTIEQETRFRLVLFCSCGNQLVATRINSIQDQYHKIHHITVALCSTCRQEQWENGFDKGYDKGRER